MASINDAQWFSTGTEYPANREHWITFWHLEKHLDQQYKSNEKAYTIASIQPLNKKRR